MFWLVFDFFIARFLLWYCQYFVCVRFELRWNKFGNCVVDESISISIQSPHTKLGKWQRMSGSRKFANWFFEHKFQCITKDNFCFLLCIWSFQEDDDIIKAPRIRAIQIEEAFGFTNKIVKTLANLLPHVEVMYVRDPNTDRYKPRIENPQSHSSNTPMPAPRDFTKTNWYNYCNVAVLII